MQMEIEVKGQRIKRINSPGSVEDTLNYLTCHFIFSGEEWGNTVKTAYFRNPASGEKYQKILADDGTCTVPWEALTDKGFVRFSVAGERENYRITTNMESFYNSETVYGGQPSEPPTPDQYDQLIALAQETKEIAESVREDADAGEFDGEPGKPGDPGKDGVSPIAKVDETNDGAVITVTDATGTTTAKLKNGKDGNPGQDATDEQVRTAVDAYMKENPIQGDTEDIIKLAIKNEASGAVPVVIADSAEMGVQDIKMQGWTEQAQHDGKNLFNLVRLLSLIPEIGSDNDSIVIKVTGLKPNTYYTLSSTIEGYVGGAYTNRCLYFGGWETSDTVFVDHPVSKSSGDDGEIAVIFYPFRDFSQDIKSGSGNVQLEEGTVATTYEPYTGGQPSPSPDYPQEIVSAGKYNEDTQKWEYEITIANKQTDPDKNQTVTLISDRPLTKWDRLEKRNGRWGWAYKSAEIVLDGSEEWGLYPSTEVGTVFYIALENSATVFQTSLCDKYRNVNGIWEPSYDGQFAIYSENNDTIFKYFRPPSADVETVEQWKTWLQSNPLMLWYETAEETFVPLSETEQEALNALRTYYPTTILDNDQGCDMALTYIADTKAYIDNKVGAIQAAIVNTI